MNDISNQRNDLPILETGRLILRMFEPGDLDETDLLFNDSEAQKYLVPQNKRTREELKSFIENRIKRWNEIGFGLWCVTEKNVGKMIGYCGFQYFDKTTDIEIVFGFLPQFWGKGFATESAAACIKFGFENLGFKKIYAATDPHNIASRCVLEKINMKFVSKETYYGIELVTYSISTDKNQPESPDS